MQAERYFGTYARFNTLSKKDAAILLGADNPIGDVFEIVFQTDNGVSTAWMKNRFGALIGFLDAELSRQLSILAAREWKLQALLSFVAFTTIPNRATTGAKSPSSATIPISIKLSSLS